MTWVCPSCNATNDDSQLFCWTCYAPRTHAVKAPAPGSCSCPPGYCAGTCGGQPVVPPPPPGRGFTTSQVPLSWVSDHADNEKLRAMLEKCKPFVPKHLRLEIITLLEGKP
jgi:hypothetical protein